MSQYLPYEALFNKVQPTFIVRNLTGKECEIVPVVVMKMYWRSRDLPPFSLNFHSPWK